MKRRCEVKHFDIPLNLNYIDKMPYAVNKSICRKENIALHSGNVIKRRNVTISEEKHIIEPMDFDPNIIESTSKEIIHYEEPEETIESNETTTDSPEEYSEE